MKQRNHQLLIENARRKHAERKYREEKEARARDIENIERECKDPFIVPALVKAFLTVSDMTNWAQ